MLKSESKQVGEHVYEVTQLPYSQAMPLIPTACRVFGPTLLRIVTGGLAALGEGAQDAEDEQGAMQRLLQQDAGTFAMDVMREVNASLTAEDLQALCDAMAKHTRVQMQGGYARLSDIAETHFPPRWHEWAGWLLFAVQVNFSSFFSGSSGAMNAAMAAAKAPSRSESQNSSTG